MERKRGQNKHQGFLHLVSGNTTDQELDNYIDRLKKQGWKVELIGSVNVSLNEPFTRRYPQIPEGYVKFLQRVASCVNAAETDGFLCAGDYNGTRESAWAWNEMEKIDLEGVQSCLAVLESWCLRCLEFS